MVKKLLPPPLKRLLKKVYQQTVDYGELILGRRDILTPPRSQIFIGAGDFKLVGQEFKNHFITIGGLKPHEAVLDVGCGIGRMAVPLTDYLTPPGRYEGFDIVKQGISWCQRTITPRFSNFRFQLADVYNTHMPVRETERYIAEISRVLKPGGRCFATFFILNEESRRLMSRPESTYNFKHELDGRYIFNPADPDLGTAFDESWVMNTLARYNFEAPTVYPGSWCGRELKVSFQDIVVAHKR